MVKNRTEKKVEIKHNSLNSYGVTIRKLEIELLVKSDSSPGAFYLISKKQGELWTCTCPHHEHRQLNCKHIDKAKQFLGGL